MKEKKRWGLTCAAVTLLVIALPIVVVLGMGVGVAAAEVVRMNERKQKSGGTHHCPHHHPTHRRGCCGRGRGWGCGHRRGSCWVMHRRVVVVVVGWVVWLNEWNMGSDLVTWLVT